MPIAPVPKKSTHPLDLAKKLYPPGSSSKREGKQKVTKKPKKQPATMLTLAQQHSNMAKPA